MKKKLFLPGPVMVSERVRKSLSMQIIGHRTEEFRRLLKDIVSYLNELAGNTNGIALLVPGSGTTAVDSMIMSLIRKDAPTTVVVWGEFGERILATTTLKTKKINVIRAKHGEALEPKEIIDSALDHESEYIVVVHNETSTGLAYRKLKNLASMAKSNGIKLLVDSVSGFGGEEIRMDWGLYAVSTCTHKALAAPPGLGIVLLSMEAVKDLETTDSMMPPPSINLRKYVEFFVKKTETPFTPPINIMFGLKASLEEIRIKTLKKHIEEHMEKAKIIYNLEEHGYMPLVEKPDYRSNTVIALIPPLPPKSIKTYLEKRGYYIALGMGVLKEKIIRIGTMGQITIEDVKNLVKQLHLLNKEA